MKAKTGIAVFRTRKCIKKDVIPIVSNSIAKLCNYDSEVV